jgi:hypothetical protein
MAAPEDSIASRPPTGAVTSPLTSFTKVGVRAPQRPPRFPVRFTSDLAFLCGTITSAGTVIFPLHD